MDAKALCHRLAEAGVEVLPSEVEAAEERLIAKGIHQPSLRVYLTELLGEERFMEWLKWLAEREDPGYNESDL